jgi:hypothetical protein
MCWDWALVFKKKNLLGRGLINVENHVLRDSTVQFLFHFNFLTFPPPFYTHEDGERAILRNVVISKLFLESKTMDIVQKHIYSDNEEA